MCTSLVIVQTSRLSHDRSFASLIVCAHSLTVHGKVVRLLCLVQLHKWRLYELFDSLGRNDGLVDLNGFDRLFALYRVIASIGASSLLQNEAAGLLLDREIEELEEVLIASCLPLCCQSNVVFRNLKRMTGNLVCVSSLQQSGMLAGHFCLPCSCCRQLAKVLLYLIIRNTTVLLIIPAGFDPAGSDRLVKSQILSELGGSSPLHCDRVAARQVHAFICNNLYITYCVAGVGAYQSCNSREHQQWRVSVWHRSICTHCHWHRENIEVLNWLLGAFPVVYLLEYILWLW